MAVSGYWYTHAIAIAFGEGTATIDWVADSASIKLALMQSTFTGANQSQTVGDMWDDVSAYEITNFTGYTAGGKAMSAATTMTTTAGSGKTVTLDGPDVVWSTATFSARGAVLYKATGTPSTSPLIGFLDFGSVQSPSAGDFTITWHSDGIATLTVS